MEKETEARNSRKLQIGAILPHTLLYGGVRRYLELGACFVEHGHGFSLYTPEGLEPQWYRFPGAVKRLDSLKEDHLDALLCSEECFLPQMLQSDARQKIFYVISKNKALRSIARHREIRFYANSTTTYRRILKMTGIRAFRAFGGVTIPPHARLPSRPDKPITILTYGRLERPIKGTHLVVKACERLYRQGYHIKLLLFDTPMSENGRELIRDFTCSVPFEFIVDHPPECNHEIYSRADIFAIAERKGGWSNTTAEAMSMGVPVVATRIGTEDFLESGITGFRVWRNSYAIAWALKRFLRDPQLRARMGEAGRERISMFSWRNLADRIVDDLMERAASTGPESGVH